MPNRPDAEETFVQLVVNHQTALRAFVLSLLPGSNEVDDVIQETNAEIWRKRGEFKIAPISSRGCSRSQNSRCCPAGAISRAGVSGRCLRTL